jgi:uncharacterized protein (TIGR03067 family)
MTAIAFVMVLIGLMPAADAAKKESVDQEDIKALQGTWQLVHAESAGKPMPKQQIQGVKLVISGTQLKLEFGGENSTGTFTIDPAKKPKTIDSTINFDGDRGKTLGIYALDGDRLQLCCSIDGKTRPKALATTPTEAITLWTYKRAKP